MKRSVFSETKLLPSRRGHGLRQHRVHGQFLALRVGVVGKHRDGDDVAHAHVHLVRFGLRGLDDGGGRDRDHGDAAGGGPGAVGHGVAEGEGVLAAADVGDPEHAVVDHAHRGGGVLRQLHGLQHQHPAGRVRVVGERVHQHAAAHGHQGQVVHGHGVAGVLAGFHVHPDQALGGLRAVAGDVRQVDRAGSVAAEREGAAVGHGAQLRRAGGLHLGEAQRAAVGVDVVLQRRDHQVLADDGGDVVRVHHRLQGAGRLDVHHDLAGGGGAAVPDGDRDGFLAGRGPGILVAEQAVAADLDLVLVVVRPGVHQHQVVAVGVGPVGEDVLADRFALLHDHGGGVAAFEQRGLVLVRAHDVQGDAAAGGEAAAVRGVVAKGFGAGVRAGRDGDLEGGAAVDAFQGAGLGPVAGDGGREDVAVGVRIVVQHGQDRGAARADADGVGLGLRGPVGFGPVREDVDGVVVRGLLVLVIGLVLGRDDVVPVVHQQHVLVDQPHVARIHVVEHHQVPVHPKDVTRRGAGLRHRHRLVLGVVFTVADILVRPGPRGVHAAAQLHRRRRHALPAERHRCRRRTVQRLGQEGFRRGHRDGVRRRTGLLELRVLRVRQRQLTPARQEELPAAGIQHHRLVPHHRQLHVPGTLEALPRALLRLRGPAPGIDRRHAHPAGLRIHAVDPVVGPDGRHRPGRPAEHRLGVLRIKPVHRRGRERPHRALGRVRHRDDLRPEAHLGRAGQLLVPAEAHLRRRDLVQGGAGRVIDKHRPGVLQHIERRRRRRHGAVQHPRGVVQPSHRVLRLRHDPDAAVVQLHLGGLEPGIQDGGRDQHRSRRGDGRGGQVLFRGLAARA